MVISEKQRSAKKPAKQGFDVGGKPKNAWAARVISEGKKSYRRAKKEQIESEKIDAAFDAEQ